MMKRNGLQGGSRASLPGILFLCILVQLAAGSCTALGQTSGANQSTAVVFFKVKKGRLIVDRSQSHGKFSPSPVFNGILAGGGARIPSQSEIETALFDDLDWAFQQGPQMYWYVLQSSELDSTSHQPLDPQSVKQVANFTGSWQGYSKLFTEWGNGNSSRTVAHLFNNIFNRGPYSKTLPAGEEDFPDASVKQTALEIPVRPTPNAVNGSMIFNVVDPVSSWDNAAALKVCFQDGPECGSGASEGPETAKIRSALKSFSDKLWRPHVIQQVVADYYTNKGYTVQVSVAGPLQSPRFISVQQQRIGRILFQSKNNFSEATADEIAYLLLADKEFRLYVDHRNEVWEDVSLGPQDSGSQALDYLKLGSAVGQEPLLNQFLLQSQQNDLSQLGFTATTVTDNGSARTNKYYVDILVRAAVKGGSKPETKRPLQESTEARPASGPDQKTSTNAASPATTKPAAFSTAASVYDPKCIESDGSKCEGKTKVQQPEQRVRQSLSIGASYEPGQSVRLIGGYSISGKMGDLSLQGGEQKNALGSLDYSKDFVLFGSDIDGRRFFRRLLVQVTGSSDIDAKRILNGVQTDDRRTGWSAKAQLEVFRDRKGKVLQFSAKGEHDTVSLTPVNQSGTKQSLNTLDLSGFFLYQKDNNPFESRFGFDATLRIGLGLAATEPQYESFYVNGNFHRQLTHGLETDISFHTEFDSRNTPIFEEASLGGAQSLRGFRQDDAIGREYWSLQNELWVPVPGVQNSYAGVGSFIRRNIKLAGFVDYGGAFETTGTTAGTRVGPGGGVRFLYGLAVFKLDWAYGLGDAAIGKGHGRVYFSISLANKL